MDVIITGGAGGIGFELAKIFGTKGYKVLLVDINKDLLDVAIQKLNSLDIACNSISLDLSDQAVTKEWIENYVSTPNVKLSVLIHCAAINYIEPFDITMFNNFKKMMDVNVLSNVYLTGLCLSELKKNKGSIIHFSSVAGFSPLFHRTSYCTSKYALQGFYETLQTEISKDVSVHIVCPTFVNTNFTAGNKQQNIQEVLSAEVVAQKTWVGFIKKKRYILIGKTAHIARWVYFLFPIFFIKKMLKISKTE